MIFHKKKHGSFCKLESLYVQMLIFIYISQQLGLALFPLLYPFAGAVNAFLCCNLASLARRKGINGQPFQLEKVEYYKVIMIVEIQIVIGGFHSKCKELLTVGFHLNLF